MKCDSKMPAHKLLIEKYLDWDKVQARLSHYEHISKLFPLKSMRSCSEKPPYYSHYLAWRMGTWESEDYFNCLNDMIGTVMRIEGWSTNKRLATMEYSDFWSFMWEIQVASYFIEKGCTVKWNSKGPDILVDYEGKKFYVECTVIRKSYALELFIEDLLGQLSPTIRVHHALFHKFSLPQRIEREEFLDALFLQFANTENLAQLLKASQNRSPLILYQSNYTENFFLYIDDATALERDYSAERLLMCTGDPDDFLKNISKEAINNKVTANHIYQYRPNLLMINTLLSLDWQVAISRATSEFHFPSITDFPRIDGYSFSSHGIDAQYEIKLSHVKLNPGHPASGVLFGCN